MRAENWMKISTDLLETKPVRLFLRGQEDEDRALGFLLKLLMLLYKAPNERASTAPEDIELLAEDLRRDTNFVLYQIERLKDAGLLIELDGYLYSPMVSDQISDRRQKLDEISKRRSESGKLGAEARWQNNGKPKNNDNDNKPLMANDSTAMAKHGNRMANDGQIRGRSDQIRREEREKRDPDRAREAPSRVEAARPSLSPSLSDSFDLTEIPEEWEKAQELLMQRRRDAAQR